MDVKLFHKNGYELSHINIKRRKLEALVELVSGNVLLSKKKTAKLVQQISP